MSTTLDTANLHSIEETPVEPRTVLLPLTVGALLLASAAVSGLVVIVTALAAAPLAIIGAQFTTVLLGR